MAGREPPTLVGREAELAVLTSAWGDAQAGVPVVVLVGGEAGIGKTALLNLFAAGLGDGVLVLRGQCVNLGGQGLAYAPLVGVLSDLVRQVGRESVIRLAGAWRADLARLVPDLGPAATDAEAGRSRLFQGVVSLLEQAASRHPVVLVVEDLHWADESTLELLRFAVRTLRDGRLMLAGSYRSDELTRRHPLTPVLADSGHHRAGHPAPCAAAERGGDGRSGASPPGRAGGRGAGRLAGGAQRGCAVLRRGAGPQRRARGEGFAGHPRGGAVGSTRRAHGGCKAGDGGSGGRWGEHQRDRCSSRPRPARWPGRRCPP